jgi:D-alanine-D-alanine ligase
MLDTSGDDQPGSITAVGALDPPGRPYTGGGPGEFYLQEDKALTKKLLAFDHVAYPDFTVFSLNADLETGGHLKLPLFVKPLRMDASIGIGAKSIVHSVQEMMQRVLDIHTQVKDSALIEEYIEGGNFTLGSWAINSRPRSHRSRWTFQECPTACLTSWTPGPNGTIKNAEYKGTKAVVTSVESI